jgi:hypothetical protein
MLIEQLINLTRNHFKSSIYPYGNCAYIAGAYLQVLSKLIQSPLRVYIKALIGERGNNIKSLIHAVVEVSDGTNTIQVDFEEQWQKDILYKWDAGWFESYSECHSSKILIFNLTELDKYWNVCHARGSFKNPDYVESLIRTIEEN